MNLEELYELEQVLIDITRDIDELVDMSNYDKHSAAVEVHDQFWKLRFALKRLIGESH